MRAVGSFLKIPGIIYILGLILTVPIAYINPESILGRRDFAGWNLVYYFIILIFGFLIFADERIQDSIVRQRFISLIAGVVLYVTFGLGITFKSSPVELGIYHEVLRSWCFILAIFGFGMKHLTGTNRFLGYATEAVLPFYMLHQPVILLVGLWVVQLQIPVFVKYGIILVLSFIGIMVPYEGLRRVKVLRFLFGMKVYRRIR